MKSYYESMTNAQLRIAHQTILENINSGMNEFVEELILIKEVAVERDLDLNDKSNLTKMETVKGAMEFLK